MKEKRIFEALTYVDEKYIDEAKTRKLKRYILSWKKYATIAACTLLFIGGSLLLIDLFPIGGSSGSGGSGHGDGNTFMSYAGPVFPLTLSQNDDDIISNRNIAFDFPLPDYESIRVWGGNIVDSYSLSNYSDQEKIIKAIYPFSGSFDDLKKLMPVIKLDGETISPSLYPGSYSGDFTGVYGGEDPDGSENIRQLDSWEGYKDLLKDGSYKNNAFLPSPILSQEVIIYKFTDFEAPGEYDAATQAISFTIDPDKTTVFSYGFNGFEADEEGFRRYSYFVPNKQGMQRDPKFLILLGEDISDYSLEGYKNGATEKGNELDGVSARITREEEVLSNIMKKLIDSHLAHFDENLHSVSKEMFLGALSEFMYKYGLLSDSVRDRYQYGVIDDLINETRILQRVFYLEFEITIPAKGETTIIADMHKAPSHDFACSGSDKVNIQGYDMVTRLGSNLNFNKQSAELISSDQIEIVRENFGFDLSKGITKVELDPSNEHYYLEIRPIK